MTTWKTFPLRRIFRVVNGGTPTSEDSNWGGGIPWATPVDIGAARGQIAMTQRTLTKVGMVTGSTQVPTGSILLSTRAPIGYVAEAGVPMAFNQGCRALVARGEVDSRFFRYQLSVLTHELQARGQGTTFQELSSDALAEVPVVVPSFDEQRRIADFLDAETRRIDALSDLTRRQLAVLGERSTESMRSATIGALGAELRPTGHTWMPLVNRGWRLAKVSHHFGTSSGTTPESNNPAYYDGPYQWVMSGDIQNRDIRSTQRTITRLAIEDYTALKIQRSGSLVIAMYGQGETKGNAAILRADAYVNQACCALRPTGSVSAEFAYYWFRSHKPGIVQLALGAGQPNLSQELIRQLWIPAPDETTQARIIWRLREEELESGERTALLIQRADLLAERRQALITAAVTGQFDVTTARGMDLS